MSDEELERFGGRVRFGCGFLMGAALVVGLFSHSLMNFACGWSLALIVFYGLLFGAASRASGDELWWSVLKWLRWRR
jgi:hypothetical protein